MVRVFTGKGYKILDTFAPKLIDRKLPQDLNEAKKPEPELAQRVHSQNQILTLYNYLLQDHWVFFPFDISSIVTGSQKSLDLFLKNNPSEIKFKKNLYGRSFKKRNSRIEKEFRLREDFSPEIYSEINKISQEQTKLLKKFNEKNILERLSPKEREIYEEDKQMLLNYLEKDKFGETLGSYVPKNADKKPLPKYAELFALTNFLKKRNTVTIVSEDNQVLRKIVRDYPRFRGVGIKPLDSMNFASSLEHQALQVS